MMISQLLDALEQTLDSSRDDSLISLGEVQALLMMLWDHWKYRYLIEP